MNWSDYLFFTYGKDIIHPYDEHNVQPNSYDLTLDDVIKIPTETGWIDQNLPYKISVGCFILASTKERVKIPQGAVGTVVGKSSIARLGIAVEFAGLIDTGFDGQITLEIQNMAHPITLNPGMKIAQLEIEDSYPVKKMYGECGNHYQNQKGATLSWMENEANV